MSTDLHADPQWLVDLKAAHRAAQLAPRRRERAPLRRSNHHRGGAFMPHNDDDHMREPDTITLEEYRRRLEPAAVTFVERRDGGR